MAERPSPERIAAIREQITKALDEAPSLTAYVARLPEGVTTEADSEARLLVLHAKRALDELVAALDAESEKARRLEHERNFWKNRYDTQHGTVHRLEDQRNDARRQLAQAQAVVSAASVLCQGPLRLMLLIYHEQIANDDLAYWRAQEQFDELRAALAALPGESA